MTTTTRMEPVGCHHLPKIPALAPATRAFPLCLGLLKGAMVDDVVNVNVLRLEVRLWNCNDDVYV
jgi:hypothetical protein